MAVHELFAYLCVKNAKEAIDFYKQAFGAQEKLRLREPGGRVGHAKLDFNGTTLMLSDEFPEYGVKSPRADEGACFTIHLHVDNADDVIATAAKLGARVEMEAKDQFYGERSGIIRDPFGHRWMIGHSIEDVSAEEMQRRYDEAMGSSTEPSSD